MDLFRPVYFAKRGRDPAIALKQPGARLGCYSLFRNTRFVAPLWLQLGQGLTRKRLLVDGLPEVGSRVEVDRSTNAAAWLADLACLVANSGSTRSRLFTRHRLCFPSPLNESATGQMSASARAGQSEPLARSGGENVRAA